MGTAVRLQYDADLPTDVLAILVERARAGARRPLRGPRASPPSPICFQLYAAVDPPRLKDRPLHRRTRCRRSSARADVWSAIRAGDILVHHPYHSFDAVTRFVQEAAADPQVLAIKMTLYRVSPTSPIAQALTRGGRDRQGGRRARRAAGPLRRGGQHPLGARARGGGRARGLRAGRLQDALQGVPGRAPGARRHPPLLPPRDRQLQRADGRRLRRPRAVHLPGVVRRGPHRAVQPPHRLHAARAASITCSWRRPGCATGWSTRIRREAEHARAGRPARDHREDERPRRPVVSSTSCTRPAQAGVDDRPHRARHLLPAPRRARPLRRGSGSISIVDRYLEHARVFYFENGGQPGVPARLRRLDAAQPRPPRRDRLPDPRSRAPGAAAARFWRPSSPTPSRPACCSPTAARAPRLATDGRRCARRNASTS